jgi:hypothetical protein
MFTIRNFCDDKYYATSSNSRVVCGAPEDEDSRPTFTSRTKTLPFSVPDTPAVPVRGLRSMCIHTCHEYTWHGLHAQMSVSVEGMCICGFAYMYANSYRQNMHSWPSYGNVMYGHMYVMGTCNIYAKTTWHMLTRHCLKLPRSSFALTSAARRLRAQHMASLCWPKRSHRASVAEPHFVWRPSHDDAAHLGQHALIQSATRVFDLCGRARAWTRGKEFIPRLA